MASSGAVKPTSATYHASKCITTNHISIDKPPQPRERNPATAEHVAPGLVGRPKVPEPLLASGQ